MRYLKTLAELGERTLELAGGKGANLGALMAGGFPVPSGFCLTTDAYRAFVSSNGLQDDILRLAEGARAADNASLESASSQIRALFAAGAIPADLAAEVETAYAALGQPPIAVAVRSSATAEDLPDLSFAGQQDTYLNVVGASALLDAVRRCWGSLWTARALGYRAHNGVPSDGIALAVVIQQMVPSVASGVLFTANPLTGRRTEIVIDATLGLGEALVSGRVEPDHYVVDMLDGRILSKSLGAKALSVHGQAGGGTLTLSEPRPEQQALPDADILELARLGWRIADHFRAPQDIEWAWAEGRLQVVQARPITSLFPLPALPAGDASPRVWFSFGVWQGMLDPFTPLGQDMLAGLVVGFARHLGIRQTFEAQHVFVTAGERLYVDLTALLRSAFGRQVLRQFIPAIDPASAEMLETLLADPRFTPQPARLGLGLRLRLARVMAPLALNIFYNLALPARGRARLHRFIETGVRSTAAQLTAAATPAELVALFEEAFLRKPSQWLPVLLPAVISGQMAFQTLLRVSAASLPEGATLALEITRGLPHNVTTEMDLALWAAARGIRADETAAQSMRQHEAEELAADYQAGKLPPAAQAALGQFLSVYGMRGIGEIDIGRPRWEADPSPVIQVLKSYLQIEAVDSSPVAVFQRGAENAEQAAGRLVAALRQTPGGWLKARLAGWQIARTRELAGLRETPKFAVIRLFGVLRQALLKSGQAFVAEGGLARADDVFFLHLGELKALAAGDRRNWQALVAERRQTYARERRRPQSPRLMLSDGTAVYEGLPAAGQSAENALTGMPVSPGCVEGPAHVILEPQAERLAPGEILVCPATDPAWTPLFLAAGGLVMEVGGLMTHGSVVAREYGIPAVVGVAQATTRLRTGQWLRVDGSTGRITLLEAKPQAAAG